MATELILSGLCPPDCSDPCIAAAPVGSPFLCTNPGATDLLFRVQMSDPCDPINDWESICTVCPLPAEPVTIENNGDGAVTITDTNNDTVTLNIAANKVTASDETGVDGGVAPVSPPAAPNVTGDLHIESYDDETIIWQWNGVAWANSAVIPHCCPDDAVALADGDFADPANPTVAEVNTYIAANGPFGPGTVFALPGGGTATEPDWAWYYDGAITTRIETLATGALVYHLDESGSDSPLAPVAPANPPANLNAGDTAIEFYDNNVLYWTYDGTNWVLDRTEPVCCPEPATTIPDAAFADVLNPTIAEVNTWVAANGPFRPGTLFVLPGGGTATEPDFAWYYDGTTTTRVETVSDVAQPFRIAGVDTVTGPGAAQPVRSDPMLVTDDFQHIGDTLFGGIVGDVPGRHMHQIQDPARFRQTGEFPGLEWTETRNPATEQDWVITLTGPGTAVDWDTVAFAPRTTGFGVGPYGFAFLIDRYANFSNSSIVHSNMNGAQHVFFMNDVGVVGYEQTVAPSAPIAPLATAQYNIGGEIFVEDSLGNVTQISSHSEVISDILELDGVAQSANSYNVFSGIGEGVDPVTGRRVRYDIDDGSYDIIDRDGQILSSGQHDELAVAKHRAPLSAIGYDGERGQGMWDHVQAMHVSNAEAIQKKWDELEKKNGSAEKELGRRPEIPEKKTAPKHLVKQFEMKKKKNGNGQKTGAK